MSISEEKRAKLDATAAERGIGIAPEPEVVTEPVDDESEPVVENTEELPVQTDAEVAAIAAAESGESNG